MPVKGYGNKVILDFVCGPDHDLIGFGYYSKPKKLIDADVSFPSLEEARCQLEVKSIRSK
ncbi:hypothetical protein [Coxiella-like endosymbiont]|uniref:hypothetical protein n=1 Tax=Coxiella-like endosymbiont TaxID=1592897 RepID=UPI00272CB541|nr:hypothetical protein [Coxiella-like endosymbiont]